MAIRLFDSLTRELRELKPSHADGVFRFYNCGPTVYAPAHIGNFRTFVINDVIRRLLELEFGADKVKHVRNITDVDDKTIKRSREEGRSLAEVTKQWTDKFHADCDELNCLRPHVEPAATTHIAEQIRMISELEAEGHAYRTADGSVYFKVGSFANYGRLSRVKERELQVGAALKAAAADSDEKEDGSDFALWKAHKPEDGDVAWDSPWGRGRPGWHIECSAMIRKHLGDTIDLHTGGVDLLFPHHENEIAQSECCNRVEFSRHWYHSEHLLVDGKKMSKSLGNLYTLDDLVAKGFSPMAVRLALLAGHPRKQLNFTLDTVHAAEAELRWFRNTVRGLLESSSVSENEFSSWCTKPPSENGVRFWETVGIISPLQNDLNLSEARGGLFNALANFKQGITNTTPRQKIIGIANSLFVFGLRLEEASTAGVKIPDVVSALAEKRWAAKKAKDFKAADALRAEIAAAGWSMLDGKDGYKLEPLKK